ncbi:MAG: TRAP transporter large permease [Pseudoflavonifractor sp.]
MSIGIFFLIFFVVLFMGLPIAGCFSLMTVIPNFINSNFAINPEMAVRTMANGLNSFTLLAIPLFVLAGIIMAKGGISEKLFNFFAYFVGNKTAGYPCAVVATCLFYGAISGSAPATTAAVGAMTIPLLIRLGYDKTFSVALVAVAGGLGVIIPPSIPFVVYSTASGASTTSLFSAGILPGLLIGGLLMAYSVFYCKRHGEDKEKLQENYNQLKQKGFFKVLKESGLALLSPIIVLGSIYGSLASPTEAAALSVIYSLVLSVFVYKSIKPKEIVGVIRDGMHNYASILFIIAAAVGFARVLNLLRVPEIVETVVLSFISTKTSLLLLIILVLLVAGCFIDTIPAIMIFTPIFLPLIKTFGVDPVHFGIIMTVSLAIGFVTPPMGINLFVASGLTGVPIVKIAKKAVPMIIMFLVALLLITFIPGISMLLA